VESHCLREPQAQKAQPLPDDSEPFPGPPGGVVGGISEEVENPGEPVDHRVPSVPFPIPDASRVRPDEGRYFPLQEPTLKPAEPEMVTQGPEFPRICGRKGFLALEGQVAKR
jgi:hypothetical protein